MMRSGEGSGPEVIIAKGKGEPGASATPLRLWGTFFTCPAQIGHVKNVPHRRNGVADAPGSPLPFAIITSGPLPSPDRIMPRDLIHCPPGPIHHVQTSSVKALTRL